MSEALAVLGEGLAELEYNTDGGLSLSPGGDAGNIAAMAARLGCQVRLAGRVGVDPFGDMLLHHWTQNGVDARFVCRDSAANTGIYLTVPKEDGSHTFHYWRNGSAGSRFKPADLANSFFDDIGFLAVTGVTLAISDTSLEASHIAAERAKRRGANLAFVMNYRARLTSDPTRLARFARGAHIVIGSREDAEAIFGESDPARLGKRALRVPELVLTNGAEPVVVQAAGRLLHQPVPRMHVANAAGAGDAFAGAYLARRLAGFGPAEAVAWGVAASAKSVTRGGCALSYPDAAETASLASNLLAT